MFGLKIRQALLMTAAVILAVPGIAHANVDNANADMSVTPTGSRKFDPDFFVTYAPVTALDMVKRIPGFSINEGEDRRGFGENAGNVLMTVIVLQPNPTTFSRSYHEYLQARSTL